MVSRDCRSHRMDRDGQQPDEILETPFPEIDGNVAEVTF